MRELESAKIQTRDGHDEEVARQKYAPLSDKIKPLKNKSRHNFEIIEIMKSMLKFNPYFRMTAFECLQQKVFDNVRDAAKEKILYYMNSENQQLHNPNHNAAGFRSAETKGTQASSPMSLNKASTFEGVSSCVRGRDSGPCPMIELAIDSSDAFDYENPDNAKYSVNDLRYILHKEVVEMQSKIR